MHLCAFFFSCPSTSIIRQTVRLNSAFEFKFERQKAWPQYILNHYSLLCFSEIRFHGYSPSPATRTSTESDQCLNNAKVCPQKWKLSVMVLSRFHCILLTWSPHFQTTSHFLSFFRVILLPNSPERITPPACLITLKNCTYNALETILTIISPTSLQFQSILSFRWK